MSLKDWERDVINRQRNIVFPDTVLNEGRFYRNLASEKAVFSLGQKTCLLLLSLYFSIIAVLALASVIADVLAESSRRRLPEYSMIATVLEQNSHRRLSEFWAWIYLIGMLAFGLFLVVKGLFPAPPPPRRRRRGYRQSSIQ